MAPSEGCAGDPAAGDGSTSVTRSSRSDHCVRPTMHDRPAAAPSAGECDADGVEEGEEAEARRGYYPSPAPRGPTPAAPTAGEGGSRWLGKRVALEETSGKSAPADGVQEPVPRCGHYRHPFPRRHRPFGEGTSAAGAEEAVLTCGGSALVSTGLGHEGGVARCCFRITTLAPGSDPTPCAQMGPAASCIPAASGGRGDGGGRGDRDAYIYGCTSRPQAFKLAPTSDLAPKDKAIAEMECMEEGYLAKIVQGYGAKEIKVEEGNIARWLKKEGDKVSLGGILCEAETDEGTTDTKCMEEGYLAKIVQGYGAKEIKVEEGNIARWLKKEGDKVSLGGILCEVETDEGTTEMECMEEGYLAKIVQGDGAKEIKVEEHVLSVKMDINGENEISWENEASEPPDFVCSDRGGCFGSKKGKLNYISKMNYYLRADCVSDSSQFLIEATSSHSRYEALKERCRDSAEIPGLLSTCASIKISGVDVVTQIFMDICGSTVSLQKNLSNLDINLLSEAAFVRAGIKPRDFYSTYAGKVLEPNRLLSCYQIPRDSTIKLNIRLRGGCAGYKTWDDVIRAQERYETVALPQEHLVLQCPGATAMQGTVLVKYLAEHMQFRSTKVLVQLCRKHYSGTSYGGNITSENILFDPDGNVHINSAPETFSEHSAKSDYVAIGTILEDSFKDHVNNCYPMHFYQLVDFLRHGPVVDYQSEAVIAFVTNHVSLLSHFERIQISESLVQLIDRLDPAVVTVLLASLDQFVWGHTVKKVPAMKHTYHFHSWRNKAGKLCVPYVENGVSFLKFSNNFFKHHDWASLELLDAAFSLVMESKYFIPRCLFTILVTLKNSQNQYPALIQSFIDKVVRMLGNNVIDLKSR